MVIIGVGRRPLHQSMKTGGNKHPEIDGSDIALWLIAHSPGGDEDDDNQKCLREKPCHAFPECRFTAAFASQAARC